MKIKKWHIYFTCLFFFAHAFELYPVALFDQNTTKELKIDTKFTSLYRYFKLSQFEFGQSFSLLEGEYGGENYNINIGLSLEKFLFSSWKSDINNLSLEWWNDHSSVKIGKFVTKVGVMDYLTSFNILNPIRASFYNDSNKNIREYAKWMIESNIYVEENAKITFYAQKYDNRLSDFLYVGNYSLFHYFIPFMFVNTRNDDLNTIAGEIFLPIYAQYQSGFESFAVNTYDMLPSALKNGTAGMNILFNFDSFTLGAVWINTYSKIPLLKPPEELLEILIDTQQEDKESVLQSYVSKNTINKMIEHVRYDKIGVYGEGTLGVFGLRGEVAYQNNFPIVDRLSDQYSIVFGIDHKGFIYNKGA